MSSDELRFYRELGCFETFNAFPNGRHFQPVPESWHVIVTDIAGSTDAIEQGHYKFVNLVGAASVSVSHKAIQEDFPYIFGGDGATLLIPDAHTPAVIEALCGLRNLARDQFKMELRVGCIPVKDILSWGATLEVAKYALGKSKSLAIFRGDGLTVAENRIKSEPEIYGLDRSDAPYTLLDGLSCNWQLIRNTRGCTLAMIVRARHDDPATYHAIFGALDKIFHGTPERANPVTLERLQLKSFGAIASQSLRTSPRWFSADFWQRIVEAFSMTITKYIPLKGLGTHRRGRLAGYIASMRTHTDYQKFDGTLRMLLDCSTDQSNAIQEYLESLYQSGSIFYGTHESENTLMTCYVTRLDPGEHVHFVDGDKGGYALAAKRLKQQITEAGGNG